jgi:hypothetical protein
MSRFPSAEYCRALEKSLPWLFLEVTDDKIVLAYGTSRDGRVGRTRELQVVRRVDLAAAGLWRPTRLLGWRTVRLPRDSDRLRPAPILNGKIVEQRTLRHLPRPHHRH